MTIDKLHKNLKESWSKLNEKTSNGITYIVCDIQPEYEDYLSFVMRDFTKFLNKNHRKYDRIIFLYNGQDTMGMVSEKDLIQWYVNNGLSKNVLANAVFYDKGYAFFRYCIDNNISDEDTAALIRFMYDEKINDSRDIPEEVWEEFIKKYNKEDVKELLYQCNEMVNIPDLMTQLHPISTDIILTGGSLEECLKEVEIALMALEKEYTIDNNWTF